MPGEDGMPPLLVPLVTPPSRPKPQALPISFTTTHTAVHVRNVPPPSFIVYVIGHPLPSHLLLMRGDNVGIVMRRSRNLRLSVCLSICLV